MRLDHDLFERIREHEPGQGVEELLASIVPGLKAERDQLIAERQRVRAYQLSIGQSLGRVDRMLKLAEPSREKPAPSPPKGRGKHRRNVSDTKLDQVLHALTEAPMGATVADLAKATGIPSGTVSYAVRELRVQGRIEKGERRKASRRGAPSTVYHAHDGS